MSVRAYKIITKELANGETFNLWHDEKLCEYLADNTSFYNFLNDDGCGTTELMVKEIKDILSKAKELELDEYHIKAFKEDIEGLSDEDYVSYDCF